MKLLCVCVAFVAVGICPAIALAQPGNFETSLHRWRSGKEYWYGTANGGFESFTNVPITELGCVECHGATDANGNEYPAEYTPDCSDCHATETTWDVSQDQCLSCHGRQAAEINRFGYSDVHRDMGFQCWDCHTSGDLHGDGTSYESMLEVGAIDVECVDCHQDIPANHDPHDGKVHCASCHAQSVISCYNCHFESQVLEHVKRPVQPINEFVMLVNRDKDGKVYPATFQSLTYEGDSFTAIGPFSPHSVMREGRTCTDCHANMGGQIEAIEEYNETGRIMFADWDDDALTLSWKQGIVPIPEDYEDSLRMDYVTYDGDPGGPPTNEWSSLGNTAWDGHQMFFATPLTFEQMTKLGMSPGCRLDMDNSGAVDFGDINFVLARWGQIGGPGDLNGDGIVDFADILGILADWGPCPT